MQLRHYLSTLVPFVTLCVVSLASAAPSLNYNVSSKETQMRTITAVETKGGTQFIRIASKVGKKELLGAWKDTVRNGILDFFNDGTYIEQGNEKKFPWKVLGEGKIQIDGIPANVTIAGDKLDIVLKIGKNTHTLKFRRLTKKELNEYLILGFYDAIKDGRIDFVKRLIKTDVNINFAKSKWGNLSTLNEAVRYGQVEIVRLLLENGADVNAERPLFRIHHDIEFQPMLKVLLKHGADVHLTSHGNTILTSLAGDGDHKTIKKWLDTKMLDINEKNEKGFPPLILVDPIKHLETIELLVEYGADVNARTQGTSALGRASYVGATNIVELLLEKGADVKAVDAEGHPPLFVATRNNHFDVVRILLKHGATVDDPLLESLKRYPHKIEKLLKQVNGK